MGPGSIEIIAPMVFAIILTLTVLNFRYFRSSEQLQGIQ